MLISKCIFSINIYEVVSIILLAFNIVLYDKTLVFWVIKIRHSSVLVIRKNKQYNNYIITY